MELSQIRYFLAVAELGNFTRAGEELRITQPALSRAVAKLEQELGQPLFERQSRAVALTDAGRAFQIRAQQIVALVDDAIAELADAADQGRIRVGAIPTVAPYLLPRVLKEFRQRHPNVRVVVHETTTGRLIDSCRQGEIDLALLAAPVSATDLQFEPLFDEELVAVLPAGHPLARRRSVALAELREQPFVLLDDTHCLSETIVSFCRQRAFQPVSVEHANQLATVEELVALGHGVSFVPWMARQTDADERRVYRPVTDPTPTRTIVMLWNPYRFQSMRSERFKDCLRKAGR